MSERSCTVYALFLWLIQCASHSRSVECWMGSTDWGMDRTFKPFQQTHPISIMKHISITGPDTRNRVQSVYGQSWHQWHYYNSRPIVFIIMNQCTFILWYLKLWSKLMGPIDQQSKQSWLSVYNNNRNVIARMADKINILVIISAMLPIATCLAISWW